MKKHWKLFLAVVALCLCVALWPGKAYADTTAELSFELNEDGTAYTVTGGTNLEGEITIPAEYNGLPVTAIGDRAFYSSKSLNSVTIPAGVTSIGEYAFAECNSLKNAGIPAGVTCIGEYAFAFCYTLNDVTLPASVTSIGEFGFAWCFELDSITIPAGVTSIEAYMFCGCLSMTSVSISEGVVNIGHDAFQQCAKLESIHIPESVEYIGEYAFYECSGLTELVIPESVEYIGGGAFCECSGLTELVIPESVEYIGGYAFCDCTGLTELFIPKNVRYIDGSAFLRCSALENVQVDEKNAYYVCNSDGALYSKDMTQLVWIPCSLTDYQIPSSITSIGIGAFAYSPLSNIVIPNSVTSIGIGAFAGSAITTMTIPDSVTEIGSDAFNYCQELTEIKLPNGLRQIGEYTFGDCIALSSIVIPDGVTEIGSFAFENCQRLTEVKLPNGIRQIEPATFQNCTALKYVFIPDTVTEIGNNAFWNCTSLSTVEYGGAKVQWNRIQIDDFNIALEDATVVFADASECLAFVHEWNMKVWVNSSDVNFYVVALTDDENLQFEVTVGKEDKIVYKLSDLSVYTDKFSDGNSYKVYKVPVPVTITQLTAPIQICAVLGDVTDTMTGYSARRYCETLSAQYEYWYSLVAEKMLRYASAVQTYFGDTTYGLADAGLTQNTDIEWNTPDYGEMHIETEGNIPVRYYGASVVFENELKLRFYFVGEVTDDLEIVIYFGEQEECYLVSQCPEIVIKDGYFYYETAEISWQDFFCSQEQFDIWGEDGYIEVSYCVPNYIERMLEKGNLEPKFADVLDAVLVYATVVAHPPEE